MSEEYKWYVVMAKPRSEYRAKRELSNQGFVSYLPELRRTRLSGGKECVVTEPLFPRYLFIRLSLHSSSWYAIRATRGVTGVVAFGDSDPCPIPDCVVDTIRDDCGKSPVEQRFKRGDQVGIKSSAGRETVASPLWGELETLDGEGRAVVLLSLFGRQHRIQVATDRLTSA